MWKVRGGKGQLPWHLVENNSNAEWNTATVWMITFCWFYFFPSQFQRTFESLRNVSSKSDLQKTYQKFQKDLENLDYLAYKRQQVRPWVGGKTAEFDGVAVLLVGFCIKLWSPRGLWFVFARSRLNWIVNPCLMLDILSFRHSLCENISSLWVFAIFFSWW